jgi:hypothetical protein
MHCKQHYTVNWISGIAFLLVAIGHALRVATGSQLVMGTFEAPQWVSIVAVLVTGGLAYWNLREAACCKHHEHPEGK